MDIPSCVDRYVLRHDIAHATAQQLRNAARLFNRWGGGIAIESVSDELLNRWLSERAAEGKSPRTVRGNRTSILMLWRDAFENGDTPIAPRRIRVIRCPELIIDGYDAGQMAALVRAGKQIAGCFRGSKMPRGIWWPSLLMGYWDLSLRLGDVLSIERDWIWPQQDGRGFLSVVHVSLL